MKKKLLYLAAFIFAVSLFHSCEGALENCQTCRYNVYVNDVYTDSQLEAEYCGADLIARKAAPDVSVEAPPGTFTVTKFECDN